MKAGNKWVIAAYAVFFCFTNWPVLYLVNTIEPKIYHLPFVAAWMLFWSTAIGLFHLWYGLSHVRDPKIPERVDLVTGEAPAAPLPRGPMDEDGGSQ